MCVQFIILAFYDELITNKILQQLCCNTYTTFSKIILHLAFYDELITNKIL